MDKHWRLDAGHFYRITDEQTGRPVADIYDVNPMTGEMFENARLLFAAPDMYQAIKGLLETPHDVYDEQKWNAAREALAKASGPQKVHGRPD